MSLNRREDELLKQHHLNNVVTKIIEHISLQLLLNQQTNPFFETNKALSLTCMYLLISSCDKDTFSVLARPGTLWGSSLKWLYQFMEKKLKGGGVQLYFVLLALLLGVSQVTQAIYLTTNKNVDSTVQLFLTNSGVFSYYNYYGTCAFNALANMFGNLEALQHAKESITSKYLHKIEQLVAVTNNESLGLVTKSYVDDYILNHNLAQKDPTGELMFDFNTEMETLDKYSLIDDYETFEEALLLSMDNTERRIGRELEPSESLVILFSWTCRDEQLKANSHMFYVVVSKSDIQAKLDSKRVLNGIIGDPNGQNPDLKKYNGSSYFTDYHHLALETALVRTKGYDFSTGYPAMSSMEEGYNRYISLVQQLYCTPRGKINMKVESSKAPIYVIEEQKALEISEQMALTVPKMIDTFTRAFQAIMTTREFYKTKSFPQLSVIPHLSTMLIANKTAPQHNDYFESTQTELVKFTRELEHYYKDQKRLGGKRTLKQTKNKSRRFRH